MQTGVNDKEKGMLYKTKGRVREMDGKIIDNPKLETKAETKAQAKARTQTDLTPQIARRAYELYEQRGRQDGQADQDWAQAELEILKEAKEAGPVAEKNNKV